MTENDITTCEVKNKHDDQCITLYTEWFEWGFKINVFTTDSIPFIGQMKISDIDTFAKHLSKTRLEYLELTRSVLSGKETSIEYILKDSHLNWKKGPWRYGMIDVAPKPLEQVFPELLKSLLLRHEKLEKTVDRIKKENEDLREVKRDLEDKLEEFISLKDKFERDIYRKFILILNSKKEKIRELENGFNQRKSIINEKEKIYEAETEDSEEDTDKEEVRVERNQKDDKIKEERINIKMLFSKNYDDDHIKDKFLKRQISDSDGKMSDSECEEDRKIKRNCKYFDRNEAKASTSRNNNDVDKRKEDNGGISLFNNKMTEKNTINFDSQESDEDIFA